jgi:hypothetical protein
MDAIDRRYGMLLVGSGLLDFAGFQIPVWQRLPRWGGHETGYANALSHRQGQGLK